MKAKLLNILKGILNISLWIIRNILPFIIASGLILEVVLLISSGKIIFKTQRFWDLYNYASVGSTLIITLSWILFPRWNVKSPKKRTGRRIYQIKIFGLYLPIRTLLFVILGTGCGLYFLISLYPDWNESAFNEWFRGLSLGFILIYPGVYISILNLISIAFPKKRLDRYGIFAKHDVKAYLFGLILSIVMSLGIGLIALIFIIIICFMLHFPKLFSLIVVLLIYFLTRKKNFISNVPKDEQTYTN